MHNKFLIFNKLLCKFNSFVPVLSPVIPVFSDKMALASHDFGQSYRYIRFFFCFSSEKTGILQKNAGFSWFSMDEWLDTEHAALFWCLVQDILQGDMVEIVVDDMIQPFPDRQRNTMVGTFTVDNIPLQTGNRGKVTFCQA